MRRVALVLAACSSVPPRPVTPPVPIATLDCSKPSRACTYQAIAKASPDLASYAQKSYAAFGTAALAKLHARGFDVLIVDPGIVMRVDAFVGFDAHTTDPWIARERFAKSLGNHRIYRGIALDDAATAKVKTDGILSPQLRTSHEPLGGHFVDQVVAHVSGEVRDADTLMSVSDDRVVSKCVAHHYAKGNKQVVVFAIDVSALDVVAVDESTPFCPPQPAEASLECRAFPLPYSEPVRGMMCRSLYVPAVESFVVHRIDPAEISEAVTETEFADCDEVMRKTSHDFRLHMTPAHKACKAMEMTAPPPVETTTSSGEAKPGS